MIDHLLFSAELLSGFFSYWSAFNFQDNVLSTRTAKETSFIQFFEKDNMADGRVRSFKVNIEIIKGYGEIYTQVCIHRFQDQVTISRLGHDMECLVRRINGCNYNNFNYSIIQSSLVFIQHACIIASNITDFLLIKLYSKTNVWRSAPALRHETDKDNNY